jgi:hypothetical protein
MPSRTSRRHRFSTVAVALAVGVTTLAAAARPPASESAVVAWARAATWDTIALDKTTLVLDTTAADVPALVALLTTGEEPQRLAAAKALGYGGGDAAIAALRDHTDAVRSAPHMLALALMQRGDAADRLEMIRSLDVGVTRDAWLTWGAANTLGFLRATEAIPALEHAARTQRAEERHIYESALRWIRNGYHTVEGLSDSEEDRLIAAVLRQGLPGAESGSVYTDEERGGVWILDGPSWRFRAGARTEGTSLGFQIAYNAARTRAIVAASVVCGSLCGTGHDYLLTRVGSGWRVDAMIQTWVS